MPDVPLKCDCIPKYQATAIKDDHAVLVYKCHKCGKLFNEVRYRYLPENCPKHQFEFEGWGFDDNQHTHEIYWIMKCDRCGKVHKQRWDSRQVGIREAVDMEDPRVLQFLELKKDTVRFHFDKDHEKDFWR